MSLIRLMLLLLLYAVTPCCFAVFQLYDYALLHAALPCRVADEATLLRFC